jgi:hypothetical protein
MALRKIFVFGKDALGRYARANVNFALVAVQAAFVRWEFGKWVI